MQQPTPQNRINVLVKRKTMLTDDIALFELEAEQHGRPLPPFEAGAHIDVQAGDALRQYSLCNAPEQAGRYEIAVLREPASRGGSRHMHEQVREGDLLQISVPRNLFRLNRAEHSILLAGGIGITPLLAMAESLHAQGRGFELHYYARSAARTAFRERLAAAPFRDKVFLHRDDQPGEHLDPVQVLAAAPRASAVYFCGPPGFIHHVQAGARSLAWPDDTLHFERFSAEPAGDDASADTEFSVTVKSTGQTFLVPAGKSIVQVLAEHGIDIPVSCEQGVCGTCLTGVLQGEIDHRDQYLTPEEQARNTQMTPCCSRSKGASIVLDL
ncbi:PDR/VanB family oxidoreductase [Parapusillimonas granuli]|nr:PDR/VanB family oxidoreductase [Parapusillimonas granuli]MBB5215334.1 vanillate O-demethylase ferredoxin subunit [Parapusillimonas granuli]